MKKIHLTKSSDNPQWYDVRIYTPPTTFFGIYEVIVLTDWYTGCTVIGRASFHPTENYTNGEWRDLEKTNGGSMDGEILFWRQKPTIDCLNKPEYGEIE